jgi:hypothetical protein
MLEQGGGAIVNTSSEAAVKEFQSLCVLLPRRPRTSAGGLSYSAE